MTWWFWIPLAYVAIGLGTLAHPGRDMFDSADKALTLMNGARKAAGVPPFGRGARAALVAFLLIIAVLGWPYWLFSKEPAPDYDSELQLPSTTAVTGSFCFSCEQLGHTGAVYCSRCGELVVFIMKARIVGSLIVERGWVRPLDREHAKLCFEPLTEGYELGDIVRTKMEPEEGLVITGHALGPVADPLMEEADLK